MRILPVLLSHYARWLLLWALVLTTLPNATHAQEPAPPTPTPTTPARGGGYGVPLDEMPVEPPVAEPMSVPQEPAPTPEAAPEIVITQVQGDIKLDVSTRDTVRAGSVIEYTYAYTNTRATAAALTIQTSWTEFSTNVNVNPQSCVGAGVGAACEPINRVGPAVTKLPTCPAGLPSANICYSVASLASQQAGKFTIKIGIKSDAHPKSGQAPKRPAGSARAFVSGQTQLVSEDTASALIVGPVLIITKTATDASKKIYPTTGPNPPESETGEFTIKVSNATASSDQIGGSIRPDATDATNIVVTDSFPSGGEFISATGNPVVTTAPNGSGTVVWTVAGPLRPGQSLPDLKVRFRKRDVNVDCNQLNNSSLNVTSSEYPLFNNKQITISAPAAKVDVVVPMEVEVEADSNVPFGEKATIKITAKSLWEQPLTNVTLKYFVQTNATYINTTASPAPSSADANTLTWTFNMPAASRTTPQQQVFTFQVLGGYTNNGVQNGRALLTAPAGVPSACIKPADRRVGFISRLQVTKRTDLDANTVFQGGYVVDRGFEFPYIIELKNIGSTEIRDIDLSDRLPNGNGANFTYVGGSATLNGQAIVPTSVVDGANGQLTFDDLTLEAQGTATLTYKLVVNGSHYYNHCNSISATIDGNTDESVAYPNRRVCARTQPKIVLTKTINGGTATVTAAPGDTVTFRLTMQNAENTPYTIGLFDALGSFEYVATTGGYDTNPQLVANPRGVKWKLQTLGPGEQREVTFTARVPTQCATREYANEVLFHNDENTIVRMIPAVTVKAKVNCGKIEYETGVSADKLSLEDRFVYNLTVRNKDGTAASSVPITNVLPLGFSYVSMDATSDLRDAPQQRTLEDGRQELRWTLRDVGGNSTKFVKVITKSGFVVGLYNNQFTAENGECKGKCVTETNGAIYSTKDVTVSPLITAEPKLSSTACANAGETRIYQLSIVNTNARHGYTGTNVTLALPLGLSYAGVISETVEPGVVPVSTGGSELRWTNLTIPARTGSFSQKVLAVKLKVGNVLGNLSAVVQANSADGAIPRKEGVLDPIISVCLPNPAIAKVAAATSVRANDELIYDITLANPTNTVIQATIEDQLPTGVTYLSNVEMPNTPAPTVSNNNTKLTWTGVTIPAASGTLHGEVHLRFKVRIPSGRPGQQYRNTATVVTSSQTLDVSRSSFTVTITRQLYLPITGRSKQR